MPQTRSRRDPVHLLLNKVCYVESYLLEIFSKVFIGDFFDKRQRFEPGLFGFEGREVGLKPAAEGFEGDGLIGGVCDHADEFPGREGGDAGRLLPLNLFPMF